MLDIRANDPGIQLVDTSGTLTYGNIDFVGDTLVLTSRGGSSSDGIIDFRRYDGTTVDTSMRIDSSGRVGIGTSSPSTPLHVSTNTDGTSDLLTLHADADGTNFGIASIKFTGNTGNHAAFIKGGHTTNGDSILTFHTDAHDSGINPQERMRIDSEGRVAISSTGTYFDTNTMLEVVGKTGAGPNLVLHRNDTTVSTNQVLAALRVTGNDNDGSTQQEAAAIEFAADGNHANNDKPGRIVFKTTADGGSSGTERMRIDSSGNTKFNSGFGSVTTVYGCRAWVKLNQTGTQSINGSGGVSSITDLGLGHTQVNFATTMPDINYAMVGAAQQSGNPSVNFCYSLCMQGRNTGNANFIYRPNATTDTKQDQSQVDVAFFR
jgi:hypothetical protein